MSEHRVSYVVGDLLSGDCDLIVQQCNCVTIKSHGLSEDIKAKYPYADLYSKRKSLSTNKASVCDNPGECKILSPSSEDLQYEGRAAPHVACLLGQFYPGKSGNYWRKGYTHLPKKDDSASNRILWFVQALTSLSEQLEGDYSDVKTVGFPFKIGCGLAGGNWAQYRDFIDAFSDTHPDIQVRIYKRPTDD